MVAALVTLAGCGKSATAPPPAAAPVPDSPVNAVRVLEYTWNHRDADGYANLLSADFRVTPISADSADAVMLAWGRDAEEKTATSILIGDVIHPHVASVSVKLGSSLTATPDPTPGADPKWHQVVTTTATVQLSLVLSNGLTEPRTYAGGATFHLVRGDSVQIPAKLASHGVVPDSTRWWIRTWDEQPGTGTNTSWLQIKRLFF